jgi:predicted small secreted protein
MMKKLSYATLLAAFALTSCKKNSSTDVSTDVTIKYEVVTSSPMITPTPSGGVVLAGPNITYVNGTGNPEFSGDLSGSSTWTKTVTLTNSTRPLPLQLISGSALYFNTAGSVTGKIYVNGELKASGTNPTSPFGNTGLHSGVLGVQYTLQ